GARRRASRPRGRSSRAASRVLPGLRARALRPGARRDRPRRGPHPRPSRLQVRGHGGPSSRRLGSPPPAHLALPARRLFPARDVRRRGGRPLVVRPRARLLDDRRFLRDRRPAASGSSRRSRAPRRDLEGVRSRDRRDRLLAAAARALRVRGPGPRPVADRPRAPAPGGGLALPKRRVALDGLRHLAARLFRVRIRAFPLLAFFALAAPVFGASAPARGSGVALRLEKGSVARHQLVAIGRDLILDGEAQADVAAIEGSVAISGSVTGDVVVLGGDARLAPTARIAGDVFVLGGTISAAPGARIEGRSVSYRNASVAWMTLLEGPSLGLE